MTKTMSRRAILAAGTAAAGLVAAPACAAAAVRVAAVRPRRHAHPHVPERLVHVINAHTEESLEAVYWRGGSYDRRVLRQVAHVLRDHRNNQVHPIDPKLLDLLADLRHALGTGQPFVVISGYRSPATNALLAASTEGVAPHSLHMEGKAADVIVPGRSIDSVNAAALRLAEGGVGYYPRSGFVHVDTGRVRRWGLA